MSIIPTLKPGDAFAVNSQSKVTNIINRVSGFNATDGTSTYNHAGVIAYDNGVTFEALSRLDFSKLQNYLGCQIVIARPNLGQAVLRPALNQVIQQHLGQLYPFWRIPLYINDALARAISYKGKWLVCSEVVAKYEFYAGLRHGKFTGTTPDQLADEWHNWKNFDIIFEGILT